jgi:hypothetical protein
MEKGGQMKKVDLGAANKGSGLTIYDRNRTQSGDYMNVAHIDDFGVIKYYDKNLPDYAIEEIEWWSNQIKLKKEKGGEMANTDQATAIAASLKGKKVPKKYQSEYGKVYTEETALQSAWRIIGSKNKQS